MKNYIFSFITLILFLGAKAQTNISGIINNYAAVSNINVQPCVNNDLTVDDASGFAIGDTVLIIQMQGANIVGSNDANFGNINAINSAGLYEKNAIQAITGNVITLSYAIENTYNTAGKVQLVTVPHYVGDVLINSVLTADAWDGDKGGVLAFTASGTVTLNASISVTSKGFRGGVNSIQPSYSCNFIVNRTDYYYPLNSEFGSGKGEGIALFTAGRESGRGKQANGGGGGNDHNSAGAGGGNGSAGGNGGINNEPGTFNCDGDYPGVGGVALDYTQNRLFLGGGAGVGHGNNVNYTAPSGAGIVYVKASSIIGNTGIINARGSNGQIISNDGGVGGSAGGSVLLEVDSWSANLTVNIAGGDGGNTTNIGNRCYGPGGGGGSGAFIHNQATFTNTLIATGGTAGVVTTSTNGCNGSNLNATNGGNNVVSISSRTIPFSNTIFSIGSGTINPGTVNNAVLCVGENVTFTTGADVGNNYQWQIDSSGTFIDLINNATYSNTTTANLTISNVFTDLEDFDFRLMVYSGCDTVYSNSGELTVNENPFIITQPTNQLACLNNDALFYVEDSNTVS